VIAEIWKGMWAEILKRFEGNAREELKDWKKAGTEELRDFLQKKELLNEE